MKSYFTILALMAVCVSSSSAQWQQQLQQSSRSCGGNCRCPSEYIPFCATDGRQEITYNNKCQLECAQKCNPGLKVRFEGVCAKRYGETNRGSKNLGESGKASWGSSSSQYATSRPYTPVRTTQRPYSPNFPAQTSRRPYSPSYPAQTTTRRSSYPQQTFRTTRRPFAYPSYPVQTTTIRSAYGPVVQPPRQSLNNPSYQVKSAVPYTVPTTSQPWWSQQNGNSGYGRQIRDTEDYMTY